MCRAALAGCERSVVNAHKEAPMSTRGRWLTTVALTVALTAIGATTRAGIADAESNGGVRVIPLGDSITEGTQVPGGYRIGLWQRVLAGGYRVDFVGSQFNGPARLGDPDPEGHPRRRIHPIHANITRPPGAP